LYGAENFSFISKNSHIAMIIKLAGGNLKTKFGEYQEMFFYDGQKEAVALTMGEVAGAENVLCRVHSINEEG
jgi:GTP cyclohydrolase II